MKVRYDYLLPNLQPKQFPYVNQFNDISAQSLSPFINVLSAPTSTNLINKRPCVIKKKCQKTELRFGIHILPM